MKYNEQWPQDLIERMIRNLRDRTDLLIFAIHARDHVLAQRDGYLARCNAAELLMDGIQNALDPLATGLEWWTLRHRISNEEIQSGSWLSISTSWITAAEAEQKRNGKQR